ncbi:autotransporter domain-containing protein [Rhizobiales bacterium Sp-1]|uniref:Autotransporter domain-containing protein n=2 Tax=Segnochrobactrum spirostomi TaxID=2608987 RepID=A0A6A7YCM9_9HYPH|nr:autotransporter domain-containing protein [Segnochrobactrum spirostomi]
MNAKYAPPDYKSGVPGYVFYWSSGRANLGYWYPIQVTLTNAVAQGGATTTATATVHVLFVDQVQCLSGSWPNACSSPGQPQPISDSALGMMGIGFDRTGHGTGYGTDVVSPTGPGTSDNLQIVNPFLNLSDMQAGTMRSGYILSQNGITLGLTTQNTASGSNGSSSPYAYAKLIPTGTPSVQGAPTDWQVMTGSVGVGGQTYQSQQAVVDIGIPNALLTTNNNAALPGQVSNGNLVYLSSASGTMQINLLGLPGLVGYTFNVTDPTTVPLSNTTVTPINVAVSPPQDVWWTGESPDTLINTGIYALNAFNYLYDATGGYIGLQLNGTSGASSAFFQPVISAIGTLSLSNQFYTDLPVYLRGDSIIDTPNTAVFAADIWGPGGLTITGGGDVTLAGANTYEGGTIVQSGTLNLTGALAGSVAVQSGGTFVNTGNYVGALSDGGTVTNAGNMVSGVSVLSGATFSNAGTLIGQVLNAGTTNNTGEIVGNVATTGTFVNDGTVTGQVIDAGLLSGNGTVGALSVISGGVVSPGHSIGTVTVVGPLAFGPGSTYVAELGASGSSDLISVGGATAIDGGVLDLAAGNGFYPQLGASYTVLQSAGGISGGFTMGSATAALLGTTTSVYPFVAAQLEPSASAIGVGLVRSTVPFASLAPTANQRAVAVAADTLSAGNPLTVDLAALPGSAAAAAFQNLSGEVYASTQSALLDEASYVRGAMQRRLRQAEAGSTTSEPGPQVAGFGSALTMWSEAYGGWANFNGTNGVSGLDASLGGFAGGVDGEWAGWRAGLAVGYSQTTLDADGVSSSGNSDNYDVGLYAGRRFATKGPGDIAVNLGAAYSWHDISMTRTIGLPDGSQALSADYDGWTGQVFGEVGYAMVQRVAGLDTTVEPYVGVAWQRLSTSGFTESGGTAALAGQSETFENLGSSLGVRGSVSFPQATGGAPLVLSAGLAWLHAYGDISPDQTLSFASGSSAFTVSGVPLARDAAVLDLGVAIKATEAMEIGVSYRGELASDFNANAIKGTLRWAF